MWLVLICLVSCCLALIAQFNQVGVGAVRAYKADQRGKEGWRLWCGGIGGG